MITTERISVCSRPFALVAVLILSLQVGCVDETFTPETEEGADGPGDCALCLGSADSFAVSEDSYEAIAVLDLVNSLSFQGLDDDVRLDRRAARNIVNERHENGEIGSLASLDAVRWVGPAAFRRLFEYIDTNDLIGACGDGTVQAALEECDDGNMVDIDQCTNGCVGVEQPYTFTFNSHVCSTTNFEFDYPSVPEASGPGTLSFDWSVCDGGYADVRIEVDGRSQSVEDFEAWSMAGLISSEVSLPMSLVNEARSPDQTVSFVVHMRENAPGGMGCAYYSSPCIANVRLTVPR